MKLDSFYGHVMYDNRPFIFVFDNYTIQLIPCDHNELYIYENKKKSILFNSPSNDEFLDFFIISGICSDGRYVSFYVSNDAYDELFLKVKWVYIHYYNDEACGISCIDYTSQEINYLYDVKEYIKDDFTMRDNRFNTFTVNIDFKERKNLGNFKYGENTFNIYGDISFKKNYDSSNNLEIWSKLSIESYNEFDDLNVVYDLTMLQKSVINLLTYRTNNTFDLIETFGELDHKKVPLGEFYMDDSCLSENNYRNVKKLIDLSNIENIGLLYKLVDEKKVYTSHICISYDDRKIYTIPRMLGIMIALERFVGWKYDKEKLRSKDHIELLNRLKKLAEENKDKLCAGLKKVRFEKKIKDLYKYRVSFSNYFLSVVKDYPICLLFIANIYGVKEPEKNIATIANRINDLRNAMAHGHIDINFTEINTKDIKLVEIMVYILILNELNVSDDEIIKKIVNLFGFNNLIKYYK